MPSTQHLNHQQQKNNNIYYPFSSFSISYSNFSETQAEFKFNLFFDIKKNQENKTKKKYYKYKT
jgi:hypothetical protein